MAEPPPDPRGVPPEELPRRLREADSEELLALVRRWGAELTPVAVRQALRNPYVTREAIAEIAAQRKLTGFQEVKRAIARHPRTAEALALQLIPGLYWRDLLELGVDVRVRPMVRRAADRYLIQRLPSLAVGEKMAIARRAGTGPISHLRHDPSPTVIGALLENPRLTEGALHPMVRNEKTQPAVLEVVARDRRWGVRYRIRVGLAKNPSTPLETALRILPNLKKPDLKAVASGVRIPAVVRRRARLLLGEGPR